MKVLHVKRTIAPSGGAELDTVHVCRILREAGHEVAIVHEGSRQGDEHAGTIPYCHLRDWSAGGATGRQELLSIINKEQPDIVHVHLLGFSGEANILEQISGIPTVVTVHTQILTCPALYRCVRKGNFESCNRIISWRCAYQNFVYGCQGIGRSKIQKFMRHYRQCQRIRGLARTVCRLIVYSRYMADMLTRAGFPAEKIKLVSPSVPGRVSRIRAQPSRKNLVLFVGRCSFEKGFPFLLEASKRIRTAHEIMAVGRGPETIDIAGVPDNITLTDWLSRDDLARMYDQATVVAMPSFGAESFGLVGLEAMAHQRPVVAFDVGGISSWLEDGRTGFLVPPGDVEAFAGKVDLLLADRHLAERMGSQAGERAWHRFSRDENLKGILETYREAQREAGQCRR